MRRDQLQSSGWIGKANSLVNIPFSHIAQQAQVDSEVQESVEQLASAQPPCKRISASDIMCRQRIGHTVQHEQPPALVVSSLGEDMLKDVDMDVSLEDGELKNVRMRGC